MLPPCISAALLTIASPNLCLCSLWCRRFKIFPNLLEVWECRYWPLSKPSFVLLFLLPPTPVWLQRQMRCPPDCSLLQQVLLIQVPYKVFWYVQRNLWVLSEMLCGELIKVYGFLLSCSGSSVNQHVSYKFFYTFCSLNIFSAYALSSGLPCFRIICEKPLMAVNGFLIS